MAPTRLHQIFRSSLWEEIRFDIDETTRPDITGSVVQLSPWVEDESCDAIWASHVLEHLAQHEVSKALGEFRRALVRTGFVLVRVPDIEAVAQFIIDGRLREIIYISPAGPITPLDMMFGHGASIARGSHAMRHGTAFTETSLAAAFIDAGFFEVRTTRTEAYEVWALAVMPSCDISQVVNDLWSTGLNLKVNGMSPQLPTTTPSHHMPHGISTGECALLTRAANNRGGDASAEKGIESSDSEG
jgi:hypothetical protein